MCTGALHLQRQLSLAEEPAAFKHCPLLFHRPVFYYIVARLSVNQPAINYIRWNQTLFNVHNHDIATDVLSQNIKIQCGDILVFIFVHPMEIHEYVIR